MLRAMRLVSTSLFLMVLIAPGGLVRGQERNTAGLYGRVTDQQGAAVPGATVTLLHAETGNVRTGESNTAGEFEFPTIPVAWNMAEFYGQEGIAVTADGTIVYVADGNRVVKLAAGP